MSPRPAKKRIPRDRKYVKEHKDGEGDLSSGTALILDAFKKNFEVYLMMDVIGSRETVGEACYGRGIVVN